MTALPPKPTHNFFPLRFSPPRPKTADERRQMIEEAAYYRAKLRDFAPGNQSEDWLAAEADVDRLIAREHTRVGFNCW